MRQVARVVLAATLLAAPVGELSASEPVTRDPAVAGSIIEQAVSPVQAAIAGRLSQRARSVRDRADLAALQAFYSARNNLPLWTQEKAITLRARAVLAELARADDWGLPAAAIGAGVSDDAAPMETPEQQAEREVAIGLGVLAYARHARGGGIEPAAISEHIDRKPPLLDPKSVLDEITAANEPDAYLRGLNPSHPEFERLRQLSLRLKAALAAPVPEPVDEAAPRRRKSRRTVERPEASQLRKVLASMQQWRWMPQDLGRIHVMVNIPEFTMRLVKDGEVIHTERVIVGKTDTPTPVFSNAMQTVVFQPNWYVPPSIKEDELVPALEGGDDGILRRRGLKVQRGGKDVDARRIDWESVDARNYVFYQPSGTSNALGQVKFLFPNRHDVYMHDTPSKGLFNSKVRAFSHGCVRVRNPLKLAEIVMRQDKDWDASQIADLVKNGPQNNSVALERKIPVHIGYFTASIDGGGKASYLGDIYGHDGRIAAALNGRILTANAKTKARPQATRTAKRKQQRPPQIAVARPEPRASSGSQRAQDRSWIRNALNNRY